VAFCRGDAFWEVGVNGKTVDTWPRDEISVFYGLFPGKNNWATTTSVKVLDQTCFGEILADYGIAAVMGRGRNRGRGRR
jgi:hypothetical protein